MSSALHGTILKSLGEAKSYQPEDKKKKWQDGHEQKHFLAQYSLEEELVESHRAKKSQRPVCGPQEERPCGDKQPKAHPPKMSGDSRGSRNSAAEKHANISRSSQ
jgi:hypothetical protein